VYRKDLFDAAGLAAPDTCANIQAAAEALHDPGNGFFGITAATAGGEVFTQQTVEQFMLANGCELTDGAAATLDTPECLEALEFYTNLVGNFGSGPGQDVVTTRATYFAGDAAMIVWSPFILDEMAGLRDSAFPACDECADNTAFLAEASGLIPSFSGPSGSPAQYGQVSNLGIGANSNIEAAKMFVEYFLSTGYLDWLSTSPEGKLPMRLGTADNPTEYIDGWKELETGVDRRAKLSDFYSVEVIDTLVQGADNFRRWGFAQDQGELVTAVYSSLPVPAAVAAILDGASVAGAADEMQSLAQEEFELVNG
jgi:multiple sugar transport system substrate-binding protein